MSDDATYRGLLSLVLGPQVDRRYSESIAPLVAPMPQDKSRLLALAKLEKCLPNILALWISQGTADELDRKLHHGLRAKHQAGVEVSVGLPADAILLKGESMLRYYPTNIERFSGDVDVLVRDLNTAVQTHQHLSRLGYRCVETGSWGRARGSPLSDSYASVRYRRGADDANSVSIELQIGGFPVSISRLVKFDELSVDAERSIDGYLALAPTQQVLLAFADYQVRTEPITLRHIADLFHLGLKASSAINIDYIRTRVRELALEHGVQKFYLAARRKGVYDALPGIFSKIAEGLEVHTRIVPHNPPTSLRAWFGGQVLRAGALLGRSGITETLACYPPIVFMTIQSGVRVYAIPLSATASSVTHLFRSRQAIFLATGAGVFALSITGFASERLRHRFFSALKDGANLKVLEKMGALNGPDR